MSRRFIFIAILIPTFFAVNFSFAVTDTNVSLEALKTRISELLSQVKVLQEQLMVVENESGPQPETPGETASVTPSDESPSQPIFKHSLSLGARGDDVRSLQEFLAKDPEIYPQGLITGYYGPMTAAAVRRFQARHGLEAVGFVGPQTISKLRDVSSGILSAPIITIAPGLAGLVPPLASSSTSTPPFLATTTPSISTTTPAISTTTPSVSTTTPPNPYSCAASNIYCINPDQCSRNGYYWCRSSCYISSAACLGEAFVPPVAPPPPVVPPPLVSAPSTSTNTTGTNSTATSTTATSTPAGDTSAPMITNISTGNITSISAILTWNTNEASDSQLEYGPTTSYGSIATNGALVTSHTLTVTALAPATSYHYRVKSRDVAGNLSVSGDYSFITTSTGTSLASHACGTAINVPQDTPSIQAALNAACVGDTIYVGAGTYSESLKVSKSQLTLKGASGTTPDQVVIDGSGQQAAAVVDVKAASNFTIDGFTIQNSKTYGYGLIFTPIADGYAPMYVAKNLIVKNTTWGIVVTAVSSGTVTIERNLIINNIEDGINVVEVGSSGSPSLTVVNNTIANNGRYGYTDARGGSRNVRNNIIVNNKYGVIYNSFNTNATISYNDVWNNSGGNYRLFNNGAYSAFSPAPATGELSLDPKFVSSADYHLQPGSPIINTGDPSGAYNDADGSRNDMGFYGSNTTSTADTAPPGISNISTANVTASSVTVTWTTNEASDSEVGYGTTASYGSTVTDSSFVTSHSLAISSLSPSTTYHFKIKSRDAVGNLASSEDNTFTTSAPPDTTSPAISNIDTSNVTVNSVKIDWTTDEPSTSVAHYAISSGVTVSSPSVADLNNVSSHSISLSGLTSDQTYYFIVVSKDAAGNMATSDEKSFKTLAPTPTSILSLSWARLIGSSGFDYAWGMAVDSGGNVYGAGVAGGAVDGVANAGGSDTLLVKYDSSGNKVWTKILGTASTDRLYGVAVNSNGDIFVAGYTAGAIDGNASKGGDDSLLIKYDSGGNKIWSKQIGGSGPDYYKDIAADGSGNVYVLGGFCNIAITKFDSNGNQVWNQSFSAGSCAQGKGIAVDSSGNSYSVGTVGAGFSGQTYNGGSDDGFVVKYDKDGNQVWGRILGGSNSDRLEGVAVDGSGNVYVGGHTWGNIDGYTKVGTLDGIVAKYDPSGNKVWSKQVGTAGSQLIFQGATVDGSGNPYFGGLLIGSLDGKSTGSYSNATIVKYDSSGNRVGAEILAATSHGKFWAMAAGGGSIYAAGESGALSGQTFAGGQADMVIAKYSPSLASVPTPSFTALILNFLSHTLESFKKLLNFSY